jgi:hypothetical protein
MKKRRAPKKYPAIYGVGLVDMRKRYRGSKQLVSTGSKAACLERIDYHMSAKPTDYRLELLLYTPSVPPKPKRGRK